MGGCLIPKSLIVNQVTDPTLLQPTGVPKDDWSNTWPNDCYPIGQSPGGGKETSKTRRLLREGNE